MVAPAAGTPTMHFQQPEALAYFILAVALIWTVFLSGVVISMALHGVSGPPGWSRRRRLEPIWQYVVGPFFGILRWAIDNAGIGALFATWGASLGAILLPVFFSDSIGLPRLWAHYEDAVRTTLMRPASLTQNPMSLRIIDPPKTREGGAHCGLDGCVTLVSFKPKKWGDGLSNAPLGSCGAAQGSVFRQEGDSLQFCRSLWLSHPEDLREFCRQADTPTLSLQQALGLPPDKGEYRIHTVSVPYSDLVRPCVGGGGLQEKSCRQPNDQRAIWPDDVFPARPLVALTVPAGTAPSPTSATAGQLPAGAKVDSRNDGVMFALAHAWNNMRLGQPEQSYPFTGLGWTYNWNPTSTTAHGVTEFVTRAPTTAKVLGEGVSPDEFCSSPPVRTP